MYASLGELLADYMADTSRAELAATLGCTPEAIGYYLTDKRRPRNGRLTPLLDALRIHGAVRLRAYELADRPPVVS